MKSRASRAVPFYIFSASSFFRAKWHKFCFLCAPLKSRHREKCFDLGTNRHRESLWYEPFRRSPSRHFNASFSRAYLIYSLCSPHLVSLALLSFFRPFSAPPLLRAAPRSPRSPRSIRTLRSIRLIRVQKKIIRVQKKFLSDSCANSPPKLSPALYKLHVNPSAIPLKSRKTQIFSNFLSQSLARFRKSPYFCTR